MYTIQDVMTQITNHPTQLVIFAFITYGFGFLQYFSSMYLQIKDKECPFYFWQHCWYFGHDLIFSLLFYQWFVTIDFWLFKVLCIGCMIFVGIELFSLYYSVKYERQNIWGKYSNHPISEREGWLRGIGGYIIGAILFATIRLAIGDVMCLVLMMSTNVTLAVVSQFKFEESRVTRKGILPLAWFTLLGTIYTFCPPGIGFFTSAVQALHQPWFYAIGCLSVLCATRFLYLALRYKKNPQLTTSV